MNYFEQIDAYTSGQMTAAETAAFEKLLQEDPIAKKHLDEWLQTESIVAKHQRAGQHLDALTNILTPLTKEYFGAQAQQPVRKVIPFKNYVYAAMAIAAILLIFFLTPGSVDRYNVAPMPGTIVRGIEDTAKKGAQLFNDGKYPEALPLLKIYAEGNPGDATAQFYYGVTLLKTAQPAMALPIFEALTQGNSAYKNESYFFAALSAYKTGNNNLTIQYATQVPKENQYYRHSMRLLNKVR